MRTLRDVVSQNVVYLGLALVLVFFSILLRDSNFLSLSNLSNIVIQAAPISVMAIGTTLVLSAREIDLSLGSVVALSALTVAVLLQSGMNVILAIVLALAAGAVVGIINSVLVTKVRIPSFLATLAMLGIVLGIARIMTDLRSVPITNEWFTKFFGSGSLLGIPALVIWTVVIAAMGYVLLKHTPFGAHILATGDNPAAAESQGISVVRIRVAVLIISASTAALAGLLYAGRIQSATYTMGSSDTLTVIAAVVVGGTSLFGGRGNVLGAVAGSVLLATLSNGLLIAGLGVSQQMIIQGLVLLVAVAVSLPRRPSK